MTPLERLLAEELPTGTFGGARAPRPDPPVPTARARRIDALEAAMNRARLEAALDAMEGRGTGKPERHLRPVPNPHHTAARPDRKAS